MAYEPKEGSGALFKNNKKEEGSKQPDYRGDVLLGGVMYEIAGWIKNSGKGPFLSLNVKPKDEQRGSTNKVRAEEPARDNDSIPF